MTTRITVKNEETTSTHFVEVQVTKDGTKGYTYILKPSESETFTLWGDMNINVKEVKYDTKV